MIVKFRHNGHPNVKVYDHLGRLLAQFHRGEFETDDQSVADTLSGVAGVERCGEFAAAPKRGPGRPRKVAKDDDAD